MLKGRIEEYVVNKYTQIYNYIKESTQNSVPMFTIQYIIWSFNRWTNMMREYISLCSEDQQILWVWNAMGVGK